MDRNMHANFLFTILVCIFTVRNYCCEKVMFSQLSVCPQEGGVLTLADRHPPAGRHPQQADTPTGSQTPTPPTPEMAIAAGDTHPTGMHSCLLIFLQVDLRTEPIETYPGPSQPVDFVLMSHVCYYFLDSFPVQIKRALQWLRPGGRLVLVHKQVDQFKREFRGFFFHSLFLNIFRYIEQPQILQNDLSIPFSFFNIHVSVSENVMKNGSPRYTIAGSLDGMVIPYKGL